jgi:glycosyltransferase involved in cell wall biosynthesis
LGSEHAAEPFPAAGFRYVTVGSHPYCGHLSDIGGACVLPRELEPRVGSVPDVSILTPSYGYGRFIRDAIESVDRQEGVTSEHLVQDAGSQDETIEILRTFGGRVRWRSERDHGQSDALNRAFQRAQGRWIAWLNADEFYMPGGLRTLVAVGDETGADVIFGDGIWVDEEGRFLRLFPQHDYSSFVLRNWGVYIGSCVAVFRRSSLGEEPWDTSIRRIMDWDLYLRLESEGARFLHVPYPVGSYRIHSGQITRQPLELFAADHGSVRARYGIHGTRLKQPAAVVHAALKLASGAYRKQLAARRMKGTDMRWFRTEVGLAGFLDLRKSCYGVR